MQPDGSERRQKRTPDEELTGLAIRSLQEGVPVDQLRIRLQNRDGSVGPDAARIDELRAGAKSKLLAMAGYEKKVLTIRQRGQLFATLGSRIAADAERYKGVEWSTIKRALEAAGESALYGLSQMEQNGHEVGVTMEEKDGRKGFRFDSCSKSSPVGIRDVNYFQADAVAENWGVDLMEPAVFDQLLIAGIITEEGTWSHLQTDAPTLEKGEAWFGQGNGSFKGKARDHMSFGGFRCSLWVPAV